MDNYTLRDVTFVIVQFYACATVYLTTQAARTSLLISLLAGALVSLAVTEWTPSVFSTMVVPFLVGSLPGLCLGEILLTVFDRFESRADAASTDAAHAGGSASLAGCCHVTETMRLAPVTFMAGVVIQLCLLILPLAVSSEALPWVVFLHAGLLLVLNVGIGLVLRRIHLVYARAWIMFGLLTTVGCGIMLCGVAFTSIFWAFVIYIFVVFITGLAAFVAAPFTSADVRAAMTNVAHSANGYGHEPAAPSAPVSAMPSISSGGGGGYDRVSSGPAAYVPLPDSPAAYALTNDGKTDHAERSVLNFFSFFNAANTSHQ